MERFERQLKIFGKNGQKLIQKIKLCVVGVGGNGSAFLIMAIRFGFRFFYLIDPDKLELSNMNRFFLGGLKDVGRLKVEVAKETLLRFDENIVCQFIPKYVQSVEAREALKKCDGVMGCVDNDDTRIFVQKICLELKKWLLDFGSGGVVREEKLTVLGSRACLYLPGNACLGCMGFLQEPLPQARISLVTPNAAIVSAGIEMLTAHLTGWTEPVNLIWYDSMTHEMRSFFVKKKKNCAFCGKETSQDPCSGI